MSMLSGPLPAKRNAPSTPGHADLRVQGRWLVLGRIAWILLACLTIAIFYGSLQEYLGQLETPCTPNSCNFQQLTPGQTQTLQGIGVSVSDYAMYMVLFTVVCMGVSLGISALLIWRRSDERMALIVALLLATFGTVIVNNTVPSNPTFWQVPKEAMGYIEGSLLVLAFLLFPTGHFVPRWTRWTFVAYVVTQIPFTFFPNVNTPLLPNNPASQFGWFLALAELATVVLVQIYRYRRMSTRLQQQQTKWVIFGLAVPITVLVVGTVLPLLVPVLTESDSLFQIALSQTSFLLLLSIPLSFGVAILRYRLWDIDTLINRALVYGSLTTLLGALYVGFVLGLTSLAGLVTGSSEEPIVLVISTLAIAALFLPVRRRIQRLIDRRFYRQKYDAEKTLAAFSARLRNEVDLNDLREHLLAVVNETMHPTEVSLWLRQPEREKSAPL